MPDPYGQKRTETEINRLKWTETDKKKNIDRTDINGHKQTQIDRNTQKK